MSFTGTKGDRPISDLFPPVGWLVSQDLFDLAEINSLHGFVQERRQLLEQKFGEWCGEVVGSLADYARHQALIKTYEQRGLPKDFGHYLRGEFDLETRLDMRVIKLFSSPKCFEYLSNFLESENYCIHYPPMLRFKVPEATGSVLPPHQDGPYSGHLKDFLTVWTPLVDIDKEVGGLIMFEGSHLDGVIEQKPNDHWAFGVIDSELKDYPKVQVDMKVGGGLLFPSLLLHESAPQLSSTKLRYSVDFRVFRRGDESTKSYYDAKEGRVVRKH